MALQLLFLLLQHLVLYLGAQVLQLQALCPASFCLQHHAEPCYTSFSPLNKTQNLCPIKPPQSFDCLRAEEELRELLDSFTLTAKATPPSAFRTVSSSSSWYGSDLCSHCDAYVYWHIALRVSSVFMCFLLIDEILVPVESIGLRGRLHQHVRIVDRCYILQGSKTWFICFKIVESKKTFLTRNKWVRNVKKWSQNCQASSTKCMNNNRRWHLSSCFCHWCCLVSSVYMLNAFRTISNKKRKHAHLQLHYGYSERYDKRVDLKIPFWRSAIFAEKHEKTSSDLNHVHLFPMAPPDLLQLRISCLPTLERKRMKKILSTFQAKELLPGPIYKFKIDASWKHHSGINPPRTDIDFQSSKAQMSSQSCSKHIAAYVTVICTLANLCRLQTYSLSTPQSFNPVPPKHLQVANLQPFSS